MENKPLRSRPCRDLNIRQLSLEFVENIYRITSKFPNSEIYGLTSQLRRSAISIPANLAEGRGKNSAKEIRKLLGFPLDSLELETESAVSNEPNFVAGQDLSPPICDHQENIRDFSASWK